MRADRRLALCGVLAVLTAGAATAQRRIVVGSKNFTESNLLGEMIAQTLAAHTELEVEHARALGGTLVCWEALKTGEIDVYPDYTGTGWSIVLKEPGKITDPLRTFLHVQAQYRERWDVEWLQPFGLDNRYALALDPAKAAALDLRTISDLAARGTQLRAAFSIEFLNREDGWPGLQSFYGLEFAEVAGMEHGLAYEAIAAGEIDLVDAYATDAKLLRYDLAVLTDDRAFFPPYHAAPLVRGELLREHPEVGSALAPLAFRLPDERMRALNLAVEIEGLSVAEVARAFLLEEGLLESAGSGPDSAAPRADRIRSRAYRDDPELLERARSGATFGQRLGARATLLGRRAVAFGTFLVERWRETGRLALEHLQLTLLAVALAAAFAIPLGVAITRSRAAERIALTLSGVVQTIPSLALLAFMIAIPGLGLSMRSAVCALFLYALLPILRNTFTGIRDVDPDLVDAARGLGLTERQILVRVQLPLATRTILAGVRTATVISIGVATLAAFIGAGGLGEPIVTGLYLNDTWLILSGALPAALLALVGDALLGRLERRLTPRGLRIDGG